MFGCIALNEYLKGNIGGGSGGGVLVVNATGTDTSLTLDKTWNEIAAASFAVILMETMIETHFMYISSIAGLPDGSKLVVAFSIGSSNQTYQFKAESGDGYPTWQASN